MTKCNRDLQGFEMHGPVIPVDGLAGAGVLTGVSFSHIVTDPSRSCLTSRHFSFCRHNVQ